jgi:hypothetical protein
MLSVDVNKAVVTLGLSVNLTTHDPDRSQDFMALQSRIMFRGQRLWVRPWNVWFYELRGNFEYFIDCISREMLCSMKLPSHSPWRNKTPKI